ncbi:S1 family serine peptidase [Allokutzneria albata]|uniref:S1 family serine peptidase n=1 Tax=Allokutzneria albata TaxID=211114 RepID=UPI00138DD7D9|nr:serine protease [Allokutzneria albata]
MTAAVVLPAVTANAVVGGNAARSGEFPSAAYVQEVGEFACGAILIGEQHVLTVASCVRQPDPATLKVVLGGHSLRAAAPGQRTVGVEKVVVHPGYDSSKLTNNVAVIRLSEKVATTKRIRPVELGRAQPTGDVVLAGWGHDRNGRPPHSLRKVTVRPVQHETCVANYEGVGHVGAGALCVGGVEGKGACIFDNGGPMYAGGKLVGVISWGVAPCGQLRYPTVGSSVAHYADWISAQLT